ncbi:MAG: HU family DNA-binding protein [Spirochaetia bacterium]|jgi:nucleoid DNA-binding protein
MTENARGLNTAIRAHLQGLIRSSGLPETEESLDEMARVWFEKKDMFEGQIKALDMRELDRFSADDPRGALLLTWSGSLLSLGASGGDRAGRRTEYASIELRTDVPHLAMSEQGELESDLTLGEAAKLRAGPVASTSALLKIAACDPAVPAEEQEKRIREATIFLTNGFVRINRTVTRPGRDFPDQLTMKSIVTYLARKNELSQKQTRQLIDDYLMMLESGLLLGLRVPLGKMGRLSLRKRPARKARVGINPATGEKITLKARPEEQAPRMAFSRLLKDRVRQTSVTGSSGEP